MTEIHTVTTDRLTDVAELFESNNATNGCWCMAFVISRSEYYAGRHGGNRERFEELTRQQDIPPGLIAYRDGRPVAWCAVGPRSRYGAAISPRAKIMRDRDPSEDNDVWFVPRFFVRVGERRRGTTTELLNAAVELARSRSAKAIEDGRWQAKNDPRTATWAGRRPSPSAGSGASADPATVGPSCAWNWHEFSWTTLSVSRSPAKGRPLVTSFESLP